MARLLLLVRHYINEVGNLFYLPMSLRLKCNMIVKNTELFDPKFETIPIKKAYNM